ncbi:hypothetical protein GGX14DRAFT_610563 [Mycena pura]|uniref:Uncharacterized protein n=1 Tax=Mycena pura TaxID=153505 RepID=A0AAD6XX95_9AGAR|nr:hypothetical protein GGX14DRAFT_610563 [Mycena pura]
MSEKEKLKLSPHGPSRSAKNKAIEAADCPSRHTPSPVVSDDARKPANVVRRGSDIPGHLLYGMRRPLRACAHRRRPQPRAILRQAAAGLLAPPGQFAVQLFRLLGFTRIVAYASVAHTAYLTKLGPRSGLLRGPPAVPAVDVVYDCTFGAAPDAAQSVNAAFNCPAPGGKVVTANPRAPLERAARGHEEAGRLCRAQGYYYGPDVLAPRNRDMPGYLAQAAHSVRPPAHN